MTDVELRQLPRITAKDASTYLGIPPQACRVLARSGKIGVARENSNRVIFQPEKLIAYKHGVPLDRGCDIEALAKAIAEAIVKTAREYGL